MRGMLGLLVLFSCLSCGGGGEVADGDAGADTAAEAAPDAFDADVAIDAATEAGDALDAPDAAVPPALNWDRDIRHIGLDINLAAMAGSATIDLAPSDAPGASFEAGGLTVTDVSGPAGPLAFSVTDGRLDVGLPAAFDGAIAVDYGFQFQVDFEGYSRRKYTLDWPNHCGNIFPCHSWPAEGQTFDLAVSGEGADETALYPETLPSEAPAYQIAWEVGTWTYEVIGATTAGTQIVVWAQPGHESDAETGMADIPAVFDWYERTLGPYRFGDRAGPVATNWPTGAYGGMEHHPFWQVSYAAIGDRLVHAHEASHGWFGDGVRIARWEDLVLSEGTATYLAARSVGQTVGVDAETAAWAAYETELESIVAGADRIAWPDAITDPAELHAFLFSRVTYMKGAFFYRALAEQIGADELDHVFAVFFAAHAGQAAGMQDLLDTVLDETGFDPTALATAWLKSLGRPGK